MKTAAAHNAPQVGHYERRYVRDLKRAKVNTAMLERLFESLGITLVEVKPKGKNELGKVHRRLRRSRGQKR